MFHEPARSVIFFPFSFSFIKYFIASSMDTGLFILVCSSPAISLSLAYVSLLTFMALSSVILFQLSGKSGECVFKVYALLFSFSSIEASQKLV